MRETFAAFSMLLVLAAGGGCARYQPLPLDADAVARGLAPPRMSDLCIQAQQLKHPLLKPVQIDMAKGLTPDGAAVVAVLVNPGLRAERDKRGIAAAQLLQARILPNPELSGFFELPVAWPSTGSGSTSRANDDKNPPSSSSGSSTTPMGPFNAMLTYDLRALITRNADIAAAHAHVSSVALDLAWKEWQVAEAAKLHAYKLSLLERQLAVAKTQEQGLAENFEAVEQAVNRYDLTLVEWSAAHTALEKARLPVLTITQQLEQERLALNQALGFPEETAVRLAPDIALPSPDAIPPLGALLKSIEARRLDLLALKMGYESQEERVRSAVLGQFPKIRTGFSQSRDTSSIFTSGLSITFELPFFDRNQGQIAIERATRRQLFDEYLARLFEARSAVATARANIEALDGQIRALEDDLPALETLVETYHRALLAGSADILTYYSTRNEWLAARLERFGLELQRIDQVIALEIATGEVFGQES